MAWGTYDGCDGNVHVLPCDAEGVMRDGHLQQTYCPCGPRLEKHVGMRRLLVVHEEPESVTLH